MMPLLGAPRPRRSVAQPRRDGKLFGSHACCVAYPALMDVLLGGGEAEDADENLGAPNCERCLTPMGVSGTDDAPFWHCESCGLVRL